MVWGRGIWMSICLVLAAGCSGQPPKANGPESNAQVQPAPDHLRFADSDDFDSELSHRLSSDVDVLKVDVESTVSPNAMPPRLEKWFTAVIKSGGQVKLRKAVAPPSDQSASSRTFPVFEVIDLIFTFYEYIQQSILYSPSKHYNVLILYKNSEIQDIAFTKRPE